MTGKELLERRVRIGQEGRPLRQGRKNFFDRCFEPNQADWGSKR